LTKNKGATSIEWGKAVSVPTAGMVMVECTGDDGQRVGWLGADEMRRGGCELFDGEGRQCGTVSFRVKSISNYLIQTQ
jgi:hypothetical protein